jgi:hypothetical protein
MDDTDIVQEINRLAARARTRERAATHPLSDDERVALPR